jgi:hypothetical protein
MPVDWKLLSYAMIVSVGIIWICTLIISVLFIQPLLDMWGSLPEILSDMEENHSTTIAVSTLPSIPLWILLIVALLLWAILTVISYAIMKYCKKEKATSG